MLHHCIRRQLFNFLKKEGVESQLILKSTGSKNSEKAGEMDLFGAHYPVMFKEVEEIVGKHVFSNTKIDDYYLETANKLMFDCTLGTCGHSRRLLEQFPYLYMLSTC